MINWEKTIPLNKTSINPPPFGKRLKGFYVTEQKDYSSFVFIRDHSEHKGESNYFSPCSSESWGKLRKAPDYWVEIT